MAQSSVYVKSSKNGRTWESNPPKDVAKTILSGCSNEFPRIEGLLSSPTLRPDGSILKIPGYDVSTGYYLSLPDGFNQELPPYSSPEVAMGEIEDILQDFPFDSQASRANAIAYLLTAVVRTAIEGSTPMFVIDAPTAGCGKTMLGRIGKILGGNNGAFIVVPSREDELGKRLDSQLLTNGGTGVIILDNLDSKQKLKTTNLASLLTNCESSIRHLGTTANKTVRNNATVAITGNNVQLDRDLTRRSVWIRINQKVDRPDEREGFKYKLLEKHVLENRFRLANALLYCGSSWFKAGQPGSSGKTRGSFEEWYRIVGGILQYCGIDKFDSNRAALRDNANVDHRQWEDFIVMLQGHFQG